MRSKAIFMALLALAFGAQGASVSQEEAVLAARGWVARGGLLGAWMGSGVESSSAHETTNGASFFSVKMYGGGTVFMSSDTEMSPVLAFTDSDDDFSEIDPKSPLWALLNRDVSARRAAIDSTPVVLMKPLFASPRLSAASASPSYSSDEFSDTAAEWAALIARGEEQQSGMRPLLFAAYPRNTAPGDLRVPALMASEWDQSGDDGRNTRKHPDADPCYNYYTPKDATGDIDEGHTWNSVCGCVATAMSQVMFFHRYPAAANAAAATDTCWFDTTQLTLPVSGDPYDWDNMVARPAEKADMTEKQRKAIGLLTSDAGRAVGMAYADGEDGESGSFTFKASKALVDVFGFGQSVFAEFGPNVRTSVGSVTGSTTLGKVVFSNLDAGYPVMFGIEGSAGGHEIVADGYGYQGGTPFVHLNMGWSGEHNVWYNLPNIAAGNLWFSVVSDAAYNMIPDGAGLGVMSGRVVDENGSALGSATVTVCDAGSDAVVTQLVTSVYGVWGAALPEGSYRLVVVDAEGERTAEVDDIVLKAPVQTEADFTWVTPLYEKTHNAADAGSGQYPIVAKVDDLGNSWGNDLTLMYPRVRVVVGAKTNIYASLDKAIVGAKAIAAEYSVIPEMEILRPVELKADTTIDFKCVLRAADGEDSSTLVNRPSGATITIASGASLAASNCVFEATGTLPLYVAAGGRVCVGPGFSAESVAAADANGFEVDGYVTSDLAVECPVATAIGQVFGHATTDDPSALSNSAARIYAPFDETGKTRCALQETSPGAYDLVWADMDVPVASSAGYYVDADGKTNTFSNVGDLFMGAATNEVPEIVVIGSDLGGFSVDLVVTSNLTVRGEGGACLLPDEYSHIVVTNGGDLVVKDIVIADRKSDTFIRVLDGGKMTLCSGATLTNLVCVGNTSGRLEAGPVYVTNGVLRLEAGSRISGCSATGAGGNYGGNQGAGVYLDRGATLDLAGGVIENCQAPNGLGGGVYVDKNASVLVSGPSAVAGNTCKKGASSNVYFDSTTSRTNRFFVTNTSSVSAKSIGVRYANNLKAGNAVGFVLAEAEDGSAASQTVPAFFSDADTNLVAVVTNSTGIAWADKPAVPAGPVPVDPTDPSAVAKVVYPDSSENYWSSVQDAFASLEGLSGSATVTLLSDDWFYSDIVVQGGMSLSLISTNTPACRLMRLADLSVVVGEGSSLSVSNVVFKDTALANANGPMFSVAGGTLEFLDGAAVVDVVVRGRFGAAVTVTNGTASAGTFLMRDGALIADCSNLYEYPSDGTAYAGGLLVGGKSADGTAPAATAYLAGGAITNCMAYRSGGVYVGNGGAVYISGDVKVVDNFSATSGVAVASANLTVSASASLVLEDVFTGEVGVRRDIAADKVVFGSVGESFSGSDADRVESAMNFTSDDGWGYGVTVGTNGSAVATHLAWSDGLGEDETYVAEDGTLYSLVSDPSVPFPVDPPTAVSGLVYNGEEQVGVVALRGYDLAGTLSATDAGTYTNTATLWYGYAWSDDTYEVKTQVWTIAKASYDMSGVVFEDTTFVYDGKPKSLAVSGELPDGVTVKYSANKWTAPGKYVVTASFTGDANNYEPIDDIVRTLTIVKSVAVPVAAADLVYNATAQAGVAAGEGYALSGEVTGTNAGTNYTVVASLAPLYVWSDGTTNDLEIVWSINPAPLKVLAKNAWKYVGADDPLPFGYSVEGLQGADAAEDVLVGALSRVGGEADGTYFIIQGELAVADGVSNYYIDSFVNGRFTISPVSESVLPDVDPGASKDTVAAALEQAGLADGDVADAINGSDDPATEYNAFKNWANNVAGGEAAVKSSEHAWVSYEFGVTELFENEPEVAFTSMAIENPADASMRVSLVVRDGTEEKGVNPESVAKLFEMSTDFVTWTSDGLTATPNPDGSYTVEPEDPKPAAAIIRLKY